MQKKNHVLGQLWIPWVCILTFGFSAFAIFAQGNPRVSAVLRLKIWTEDRKHAYAERYKIPIHIELTNVTSRDVFIGRDVWSNIYPSHVTLIVMPTDGHAMTGEAGNVDGLGLSDDLAKAMLNCCFLLPPGNSYGSTSALRQDLAPGTYKVRAVFESEGIESGSFYNPLLNHPQELEKFRSQNWKGIVVSNDLTVRIVSRDGKSNGRSPN